MGKDEKRSRKFRGALVVVMPTLLRLSILDMSANLEVIDAGVA